MDSDTKELLGMVAELRREVREIRALLAAGGERVNAAPMAPDALTVHEFARAVGRSADWVYDQIRLRRVRVLPLGKPYRIARAEALRLCDGKGGRT